MIIESMLTGKHLFFTISVNIDNLGPIIIIQSHISREQQCYLIGINIPKKFYSTLSLR